MALSYSGIVNYGKVTLPAVTSWNTSSNITRDPPRSVHTRKIDKVGETPAITSLIDDSGDRFCEAINYYPRGQNPMVSVSYGEGQTAANTSSRGNAFLPYRIARDGAFRPPIFRQEDLVPLSRLPRIWTNISTQPYSPIFTMRIQNCGTAENTKEVRNSMLSAACVSNRTIAAYPNVNAPDVKSTMIRDPLVPGEVNAAMSCNASNSDIAQRIVQKPVLLAPTRNTASGFTNPHMIWETPVEVKHSLNPNHPLASGFTNPQMIKEIPVEFKHVLTPNRPMPSAVTNFASGNMAGYNPLSVSHPRYNRLATHASKGGFENYPSIPEPATDYKLKNLVRVR